LKQTYTKWELIVVNDGSTEEETREYLAQIEALDSRIKVVHFEANRGISAALNHGIEVSQGKYIARLDSDDMAVEERLSVQVEFLERNKNISILGSSISINEQKVHTFPQDDLSIKLQMPFFCCLAHPSLMIRKDVVF
jgi:glycosyltransferase involved in cell wall biosynthesis